MMPRTVAPPPTDKSMWRRLLKRTHPDQDFENLTDKALSLADTVDATYRTLLFLLEDIEEEDEDSPLFTQQQLGATYKTLAAIGHASGMDKAERALWYKLAEQIPLSQRHAGHILTRLKKGGN